MKLDASEARNTIVGPNSAGSPSRRIGIARAITPWPAAVAKTAAFIGVGKEPGHTPLTCTLWRASSRPSPGWEDQFNLSLDSETGREFHNETRRPQRSPRRSPGRRRSLGRRAARFTAGRSG